jgi:ketosteroid isomerase-like protein
VRAVAAGDIAAYDALLAGDAVFMPPNGPAREGSELRNWFRDFAAGIAVEWLEFSHVQTEVDGNLGYRAYTYKWRVTPRAGGEATLGQGKGLHVVRRDIDGRWKIVPQIYNVTAGMGHGQ